MENQITLNDFMKEYTYDRTGKLHKCPTPYPVERCELCKYWEQLPVEEQPPAGWGVQGQCNCTHEPEMMKNGYWIVSKLSYCNDFISKF